MKKRKKIINQAELTIPSISRNEALSRSFIGAFLMQADPTVEEISDVKCAVSEAVTNSIVHAYREKRGKIRIRASLDEDNVVTIDVADRGCGIEDVASAMTMRFTTNTDGERSGMGFTVMKTFTDKVKVYSKIGRGTRVRLVKRIGKADT
ncbi:MAG: anti-sigma F factor [Clostridia bacterium]|nr:anti-sigma F factor [Clostridia bacterium]